jgi:hypothetical protein
MQQLFAQQRLKTFLALGIVAGMLAAQPALAIGEPFTKKYVLSGDQPEEDKPAKKNKLKTKTFASLNNSSVKIYPDVVKRDMHVVAKENDGKPIDFFVFDVEGALVQHYKMKAKDHNKISGLARGTYVYRVFSGDEETAAGNFQIR